MCFQSLSFECSLDRVLPRLARQEKHYHNFNNAPSLGYYIGGVQTFPLCNNYSTAGHFQLRSSLHIIF